MGDDMADENRRGHRVTSVAATPRTAIRALMSGAIDYAGLFPPASLGMADAVARYASYRESAESWMLGRFVLPVARLGEFIATLPESHGDPWHLAVIAKAPDAAALANFNASFGARAVIDAVETPVVSAADAVQLGALSAYEIFAEVNATDDPAPVVAALKRVKVGAKIRTGGVTPGSIPSAANVARFMVVCAGAGVRFKATAGLHHALRAEYALTYEPNAPRGTMFGFLNVLLASAAARAGGDEAEVTAILEARRGFSVGPTAVVLPSGRALAMEEIAGARETTIASFGSCSFDEPVAELREGAML